MEVLRDENFQELLINYPRPEKQFWRALDAQDEVTSGREARFGDDEVRPDDNIKYFCEFVQNNKEQINSNLLLCFLQNPEETSHFLENQFIPIIFTTFLACFKSVILKAFKHINLKSIIYSTNFW